MTARMKLSSRLIPVLTLGMLVMQLLDPSKIWQALIVAFGGTWLVAGPGLSMTQSAISTVKGMSTTWSIFNACWMLVCVIIYS